MSFEPASTDLFARNQAERLPLHGAEINYWPNLEWPLPQAAAFARLRDEIAWQQQSIQLFGQFRPQPRLTAWHGDAGTTYTYSGLTLEPVPWTPLLTEIRRRVEAVSGHDFNSVLLNFYRDGQDSMGLHSDDEAELGPKPCIASVSLGAPRHLIFKHRRKKTPRVRIELAPGSLLLMAGDTQRNWRHGIPKTQRDCGPRINLTFRQILHSQQRG